MPPVPAVFSRCSGQVSLSASACAMTLPARLIAGATLPASALPGCRTTACAPSASPARSEAISEARVLARISLSVVAALSR